MSTVKTNNVQIGQSLTATNNFTWYQPSSPDGTVRLGVGNSGATTSDVVTVSSSGLSSLALIPSGSSAPTNGMYLPTTNTLGWSTGSTERLRLDAPGNLGLGVTPSAWASYKAIDLASVGAIASVSGQMSVFNNSYWNGTNQIYKTSNYATYYNQNAGTHAWFTAPSGTAGNAITFTQAMTLDASSNLTIAGSTATKASGTTWANPSDTRLKDNQQIYQKGLNELVQIVVKTWEFNGKGGSTLGAKGLGVIADEIETILPDSVDTYKAKLNDDDANETDIKRFDASEITWLLVKSVQELSAQVTTLQAEINALKA